MIRRPAFWLVALLALVLDQGSKVWALSALADGHAVPIVDDLLFFQLVHNSGAAFSLLDGSTWIVTAISLVMVAAIVWLVRKQTSTMGVVLLAAALGGALGNLGDRAFRAPSWGRGHVVDFIGYGNWFVGNVADIFIVGVAIVVVIAGLFGTSLISFPGEKNPEPADV